MYLCISVSKVFVAMGIQARTKIMAIGPAIEILTLMMISSFGVSEVPIVSETSIVANRKYPLTFYTWLCHPACRGSPHWPVVSHR